MLSWTKGTHFGFQTHGLFRSLWQSDSFPLPADECVKARGQCLWLVRLKMLGAPMLNSQNSSRWPQRAGENNCFYEALAGNHTFFHLICWAATWTDMWTISLQVHLETSCIILSRSLHFCAWVFSSVRRGCVCSTYSHRGAVKNPWEIRNTCWWVGHDLNINEHEWSSHLL